MKQYDLQNLPFDPALEAGKASKEYRDDDPNRPETEEDAVRAGASRRLGALHQSQAFRDQSRKFSQS